MSLHSTLIFAGFRPEPPPVPEPPPAPEPNRPDVAITFDPETGFQDGPPGTLYLLPVIDQAGWNNGNRPQAIEARAILATDYIPESNPLDLPPVAVGGANPSQPGAVSVPVSGLAADTAYAFVLVAHFN